MTKRNPKQVAFLAAYRVCGNISQAARSAGINRADHYRWIEDDPAYAEEFATSHEEACDALEEEARKRAVEGWDEPVLYKGQPSYAPVLDEQGRPVKDEEGEVIYKPLTIKRKDTNLLIFLLKGAKPDKFRDNFKGEITGPGGRALRSSIDLTNLTDEQLELLESLARAASQPKRDRGGEAETGSE